MQNVAFRNSALQMGSSRLPHLRLLRSLQHPNLVQMEKRKPKLLLMKNLKERTKKKSKECLCLICSYRGVTVEKKMEFVEKVKKLTNEGLTKMVEHV